ncbi:hypothetical protein F5I97DRAFT_334496 [Phlebopus sp. FC_14]|nr:hypothetical protein F5I97DRAFT_334496 [Phlebopus sp. FC_14]
METNMLATSFALQWGPGICGFMVAMALFGCTLGQFMFYLLSFPKDLKSLKLSVVLLLVVDALHTYCVTALYWKYLGLCHGVTSPPCPTVLPWEMLASVLLSYFMSCMVKSFYAHRVFIISERNYLLAGLITATTATEFVLGMLCVNVAFIDQSATALYSTPWSARSAVVSACCDILITGSVFFYLRAGRRETRRRYNYFRQLMLVFVNMGLFTCVIAIGWCLLYVLQNGNDYIAFPTTFICKSYANSMLAVLNARKSMRERDRELCMVGLSTISG